MAANTDVEARPTQSEAKKDPAVIVFTDFHGVWDVMYARKGEEPEQIADEAEAIAQNRWGDFQPIDADKFPAFEGQYISPRMIKTINRVLDRWGDDVEMDWLTTVQELAEQVRSDIDPPSRPGVICEIPQTTAQRRAHPDQEFWWKAVAILEKCLETGAAAVWIDDELKSRILEHKDQIEVLFAAFNVPVRIILVESIVEDAVEQKDPDSPDEAPIYGIAPDHIREVNEYIKTNVLMRDRETSRGPNTTEPPRFTLDDYLTMLGEGLIPKDISEDPMIRRRIQVLVAARLMKAQRSRQKRLAAEGRGGDGVDVEDLAEAMGLSLDAPLHQLAEIDAAEQAAAEPVLETLWPQTSASQAAGRDAGGSLGL